MGTNVQGAALLRAIGLRAMLASRRVFTTRPGSPVLQTAASWASNYRWDATFIVDSFDQMESGLPGFWTAARIRTHLDAFALSRGTASTVWPGIAAWADLLPASWFNEDSTPGNPFYLYDSPRAYGPPLDGAALMALMAQKAYDLGDHSVVAVYGASITDALDALPRSGGLLYSNGPATDPGLWQIGWDKEDATGSIGHLGFVSVMSAVAYRAIAAMATAEGNSALATRATAGADAFVSSLAALRRGAGAYQHFYNSTDAAGSDPTPHTMLTSWMVIHDLCGSSTERDNSARALVDAFNAGNLTSYGWVRYFPKTYYLANFIAGQWPDIYENGGFWSGEFVKWLSRAMAVASSGYGTSAIASLFAQNVTEFLRQQRSTLTPPLECLSINPPVQYDEEGPIPGTGVSSVGQSLYCEAAAHVGEMDDSLADMVVELNSGNGWAATIDVPFGHCAMRMTAATSSPGSYQVSVFGTPYLGGSPTAFGSSFSLGSESGTANMVAICVAASVVAARAARFDACYGGRLSVRVTSGTPPGPVTVTIRQTAPLEFRAGTISGASPAPPVQMPPGYVLEAWSGSGDPPVPVITGDEAVAWSRLGAVSVWHLLDGTGATIASGPAGSWPFVLPAISASASPVVGGSTTLTIDRASGSTVTVEVA